MILSTPPPMAEAYPSRSQVLCRYFLHGVCNQGDQCKFAHNLHAAPSMICQYYLKGHCNYGDRCRFDHVRPEKAKKGSEKKPARSPPEITQKPPVISDSDTRKSKFVSLRKGGELQPTVLYTTPNGKPPEEWVKAPEFKPTQTYTEIIPPTYAEATQAGQEYIESETPESMKSEELCPYAAEGECWFGDNCTYLHGDLCELCGLVVLHPTNQDLRRKHILECTEQHEKDMELAFAVASSKDKVCGICMDVVLDKHQLSERRFGILPNCQHIFCLSCIRKWRCAKQFENKIIRACPECRVQSDFVAPSQYWVETEEEKAKLIQGYKKALSAKPCRYFDQGKGECPFNEKCFYLHAYPDGKIAEPRARTSRRKENSSGELELINHSNLWDYLQLHYDCENGSLEEDISLLLLSLMLDSSDESDDDIF